MKFIVKLNFGQSQSSAFLPVSNTVTLVCEADNVSDIINRYTQEDMFAVQTQTGVKIINPKNVHWIDVDEYKEQPEQEQNSSLNNVFPNKGESDNE